MTQNFIDCAAHFSTLNVGDMNIHVGHNQVHIEGMKDSSGSVIDASIKSVINLGNIKQ